MTVFFITKQAHVGSLLGDALGPKGPRASRWGRGL